MFNKPFNELTLEDIIALKENGVPEGKTIDYKLELNLNTKGDKKEFAKDIASFLNTIGGDLIIGVEEKEGVIADLPGIEVIDKDKFSLSIENSLRDLVKPRLIGLEMNYYPVGNAEKNNKYIVHFRVPQSYVGPHFVSDSFFARNSVGTYPLEYTEIKQKFTLSNQINEQIRNYHLQRIMKIKADEGYFELREGSSVLIHLVPLQSFSETFFALALTQNRFKLNTLVGSYDDRIHFEGIAGVYKSSYHHINRQGIIEIADREFFKIFEDREYFLAKDLIERILTNVIPNAISNLAALGLNTPYVILTSLLDVKGKTIKHNADGWPKATLRQNDLIFPAITISNPSDISEYDRVLKELFMNTVGVFYTQFSL